MKEKGSSDGVYLDHVLGWAAWRGRGDAVEPGCRDEDGQPVASLAEGEEDRGAHSEDGEGNRKGRHWFPYRG